MASYFFCCSYPLANGSVVEPGNWGRILRSYNLTQPNTMLSPWLLLRETAFELVRFRQFPTLPSRLEAVFVCENRQDLETFKSNGRILDISYEVELTDPTMPLHRGCLSEFTTAHQGCLDDLEARAQRYWMGTNVVQAEIVTLSPIRILRRL